MVSTSNYRCLNTQFHLVIGGGRARLPGLPNSSIIEPVNQTEKKGTVCMTVDRFNLLMLSQAGYRPVLSCVFFRIPSSTRKLEITVPRSQKHQLNKIKTKNPKILSN
jgi:hypothetical protein